MKKYKSVLYIVFVTVAITAMLGCQKKQATEQETAFATKLIQCAAGADAVANIAKLLYKDPYDKRLMATLQMAEDYRGGAKIYAEIHGVNQSELEARYKDFSIEYKNDSKSNPAESCHEFYSDNVGTIDEVFLLSRYEKNGRLNEKFDYPQKPAIDKNTLKTLQAESTACLGLHLALSKRYKNIDDKEMIEAISISVETSRGVAYYSKLILDGAENPNKSKFSLKDAINTAYLIRREAEDYAKELSNSVENYFAKNGGIVIESKLKHCTLLHNSKDFIEIWSMYDKDVATPDGFNPK
jgi:hypothetical protein